MAHMIPIWAIYMYATYYVPTLNGHHFCNQMDVNSSILWLWLYKLCSHKLILNSWMFKNWLVEESIQNEMCDTKNVFYILKSVSWVFLQWLVRIGVTFNTYSVLLNHFWLDLAPEKTILTVYCENWEVRKDTG